MLRMIIADDEYIVRDGLKNIVEWETFGIEVIAEAEDGQEAYELCEQLHPDILFTDIRMPLLDGLEVALKLKEQGSDIKVIIISGVQDFNYAKTALDVNAEGYILKPIKIDELKKVVKRVADGINKELNREQEMLHMKEQLHENFPVIREKFLRNLILGIFRNEQDVRSKLDFLDIPFQTGQSVLVSTLQIDNYTQVPGYETEEDRQLLSFSVSNIIEEIMSNNNCGISFCLNENEFILIFNNSYPFGSNKHMEIFEEISSCLNRFLKITVSIGIGSVVKSYLQIVNSYKDASVALDYKFYTGKNSIISINDINNIRELNSNQKSFESYNLFESENQLMSFMKLGDSREVETVIEDIFNLFASDKNLSVVYIQSICVEMVCIASRALCELEENIGKIVSGQAVILETIYNTENVFDLKNYMLSIFIKISAYFSNKHNQKNSKVIFRIKEIIEKRYMEDLSISKLSEEIFLTPNYISQIFKQGTGETVAEYITKVRMEQAKELLKSTDFKVLEIAEIVGFENPHYFSTVFRKYTGIHPQKFRSCSNT